MKHYQVIVKKNSTTKKETITFKGDFVLKANLSLNSNDEEKLKRYLKAFQKFKYFKVLLSARSL